MSESVDVRSFMDLAEEDRWSILRQLDITSFLSMYRTNTDFKNTVTAMFLNEVEFRDLMETQIRQGATAMDLQPLLVDIYGGMDQARTFWDRCIVPQAESIMGNIETRLRNREYKDSFGNNPTDGQLWSAIQDAYLLSPERTLDWLKKFEALRPEESAAIFTAEQDKEVCGSLAPSATYDEIVSAARKMFERRGAFFAAFDTIELRNGKNAAGEFLQETWVKNMPIDDAVYSDMLADEQAQRGFILRSWLEHGGNLRIDGRPGEWYRV